MLLAHDAETLLDYYEFEKVDAKSFSIVLRNSLLALKNKNSNKPSMPSMLRRV